jgi:hypothetical protein
MSKFLKYITFPVIIYWYLVLIANKTTFDDSSFYYKYIKNILTGDFWKYNLSDTPIWGASAPFWPVFASLPKYFNSEITIEASSFVVSIAFSIIAVFLITSVLIRFRSLAAGIAFIVVIVLNFRIGFLLTQGLETPLSVLILSFGFFALFRCGPVVVCAIAVMAFIHKIDIAPYGFFLLLALYVRDGKIPLKCMLIIFLGTISWYLFAYYYFGSFLPHTLAQKISTSGSNSNPWYWFIQDSLWINVNKVLSLLVIVLGAANFIRDSQYLKRPYIILLFGFIFTVAAVYSIKVPLELFIWYNIPVMFALCMVSIIVLFDFINIYSVPGFIKYAGLTTFFATLFFNSNYADILGINNYLNH